MDKKTNLEMFYWKMLKRNRFNFLKIKKLLNSMKNYYFLFPYLMPKDIGQQDPFIKYK